MDTDRPRKRQRTSSSETLPTPPALEYENEATTFALLKRATNVLATACAAMSHIAQLYETDALIRQSLSDAIAAVIRAHRSGKKLVICGVGKSAYIGMKFAATCKSLGIRASFLHACEAAHGDLGDVDADDIVLFVSYSGRTPELVNLIPHLAESTLVMAISSQESLGDCPLLAGRTNSILLPAPIPQLEETTFGVGAPTTSTTVALAVTDMLALSIAEEMYSEDKQRVFKRNHPGGSIGIKHSEMEKLKKDGVVVSILELPSPSISAEDA